MNTRVQSELLSIQPLDELEALHLSDALAWVESGAPIFRVTKPATPPKHLVSYFAEVDERNVLLVDHKNAELWLPTGGHVEPGEDPRVTVVRELQEELGLAISAECVATPLMVTVTETVGLTAGHIDVSLWYVIQGDQSASLSFDREEFNDVRWFPFGEVPIGRCDPNLPRFLSKVSRSCK